MQALSQVQEFLGVPVRKLISRQVKIHTRTLPDLVKNWEEVSSKLNGTGYARFLDGSNYAKWCKFSSADVSVQNIHLQIVIAKLL
jgi:hypothetical protein